MSCRTVGAGSVRLSGGRDLDTGSGGDRRADPAAAWCRLSRSSSRSCGESRLSIRRSTPSSRSPQSPRSTRRGQRTARSPAVVVAGPFHGVPFTAKDVFETAGVETRVGLSERVGIVPSEDAVAVARMRRAGAILLGKTNVPPGGSGGVTDNTVHGRTRNPFDRERSVAGSSGGEAAIQAAGGSPIGLGSDSGGSLRVPAHYCGIATLKPTTGRVPNTGAFGHKGGLSDSRTQIGPLSRFVEDLAPTLSIIAGPDSRDSGVVPVPLGDSGAVRLGGLRVAFYTEDGETDDHPRYSCGGARGSRGTAAVRRPSDRALPGERRSQRARHHQALLGLERPRGREVRPAALPTGIGSAPTCSRSWSRSTSSSARPRPAPAPLHGEGLETMFNYTLPYSLTGQPCVVVPSGRSRDGLPIGVQIVGRVWREDQAVAAARSIETTIGGWRQPTVI